MCAHKRDGGEAPLSQRVVAFGAVVHHGASHESRSSSSKSSCRAQSFRSSRCGATTATSSRTARARSTPESAFTLARSSNSYTSRVVKQYGIVENASPPSFAFKPLR